MGYCEGLDGEIVEETKEDDMKGKERTRKRPYHIWEVKGQEHKLKLSTKMIGALEKKYKTNILNLVSEDGLPPLSVMLTIIQAAINTWEHGMDYDKVRGLYDMWCEEGGNQIDLLAKVIMPTLVVSGFFTEAQGEAIMTELEGTEELI